MGNLLGEPFKDYVTKQINDRQAVHGKANRTVEELQYLNSRNAWIKLASGTSMDQSRLDLLKKNKGDQEENPLLIGVTPGMDLAVKNVLFNGLTSFGGIDDKQVNEKLKRGLFEGNRKVFDEANIFKGNYYNFDQTQRAGIGINGAYGVGGTSQHGYSPMPGIIDADIKDLNRGSIKKATINIKAHNRNQFDVIDALYLRLGYTIMLEWGVDKYLNTLDGSGNGNVAPMGTTLIDKRFFLSNGASYSDVLPEIEKLRRRYNGNYDGMFGVISNFSWTFEADGTYNIKLEIMSQGDIIESLKANLPPNNGGENDPDKYSKIRLELLKTEATTDPDVFYKDLYPGLEEILKNWYEVGIYSEELRITNDAFTWKVTPVGGFPLYVYVVKGVGDFPVFRELAKSYKNDDKINQDIIRGNQKLSGFYEADYIEVALANSLNIIMKGKFEGIFSKLRLGDKFTVIGNTKQIIESKVIANGRGDLNINFSIGQAYKEEAIRQGNRNNSTIYTVPLADATYLPNEGKSFFINNLPPFEDFKNEFFNQFAELNLAGGADDPQFAPPTEEVDSDKQAELDAEKKMQDNAGKNKVFSYFYKIYKFGSFEVDGEASIYSNFKSIVKAAFSLSRDKITAFENEIGEVKNPRYSDPTIWNKQVGFPTYTPSNNSADIIKLDITPIENQHFIRFGTFLEYFEKNVIPKIDNKGTKTPPPVLKIDYHPDNNICYVIDNSISLNPNKTIIPNPNFYSGTEYQPIYPELNSFIETTGPDGFRYGNIMNVYFSFNRIEKIMDDVDTNNQISVYKVLKSLATDINESLGNVNNIEPIIDKESNIIRFIDQTSIPGLKTIADSLKDYEIYSESEATFEVFGINPKDNTSNFVRSAGITTEISKEYATIITIGATANGAIPGAESTAFSKWNVGIEDRFKNKLIDGEAERGQNLEDQNARVLEKYVQFIGQKYEKLGFHKNNDDISISSDYISANKSQVLDYYIYAQSETSNKDPEYIESSIGFLPFNLKLSMDGLSGIKIYNKINVNTAFLPSNYGETLSFIVTGVNHKLSNNEWVTNLDTIATTKEKQDAALNVIDTEELLNGEKQPQPQSRTSEGPVAPKSEIIDDVSIRPTEPI